MPDKLLTTRELVDMLQLDRVTIYKMVKDGELPSLRVGGQWRFSEEAIGAWLRGRRGESIPEPTAVVPEPDPAQLKLTDLVPLPTLQAIQNQFSELLGVASFLTDLDGQPLAPCSRCARFCRLVHTWPEGMQACQASWRAIGRSNEEGAAVHTCHAGIQYASAPIIVAGQRLGMVTAGQFLTESPDPDRFRRASGRDRSTPGRRWRGVGRGHGLHRDRQSRTRGADHQLAGHHRQRHLRHRLSELSGAANTEPDCTTLGSACVGSLLTPPAGLSSRGGDQTRSRHIRCAGNPSAGCHARTSGRRRPCASRNGAARPCLNLQG